MFPILPDDVSWAGWRREPPGRAVPEVESHDLGSRVVPHRKRRKLPDYLSDHESGALTGLSLRG
jgi:hypothetical protein